MLCNSKVLGSKSSIIKEKQSTVSQHSIFQLINQLLMATAYCHKGKWYCRKMKELRSLNLVKKVKVSIVSKSLFDLLFYEFSDCNTEQVLYIHSNSGSILCISLRSRRMSVVGSIRSWAVKPTIRVQCQLLHRAVKSVATKSMSHSELMQLVYILFYKKRKCI